MAGMSWSTRRAAEELDCMPVEAPKSVGRLARGMAPYKALSRAELTCVRLQPLTNRWIARTREQHLGIRSADHCRGQRIAKDRWSEINIDNDCDRILNDRLPACPRVKEGLFRLRKVVELVGTSQDYLQPRRNRFFQAHAAQRMESGPRSVETLDCFIRFGSLAGCAIIGFTNNELARLTLKPR